MSMKTSVRLAKRGDLPAIHNLVRELAIYEKAEHEFVASLDEYRRDFEAGIFEALVAENSVGVVGMARLRGVAAPVRSVYSR